ncbi:hypothetical protein [Absidia glauca]|uniref:Uncharacterized protein n=1 Tax=Absidia glauca TaxID=4829 RepID=A0A168PT45_ABSGL|nr:hypothetical protein [Absidia glauca]
MQLLSISLFLASSLQTLVSAVPCTKKFGQYVDQQAYDCCIYMNGKPQVSLFGCSYGQCRKLTCDLPQANSTLWDCYSGPKGTYSTCAGSFKNILGRCTPDQMNNGVKCPFTTSVAHM